MPTNYIVLQRIDSAGRPGLKQLGVHEATGPHQAIKALAKGAEGRYIAVPVRNWTEADGAPKTVDPQFVVTEIEDPFELGEQTTIDQALSEDDAETAREHMRTPVRS